jgi:hypothetical protein
LEEAEGKLANAKAEALREVAQDDPDNLGTTGLLVAALSRAEEAERRIAAVEEAIEIGLPDERDFTAPAEYIRGAMDAHEWWHAKLRAALHPVAETTDTGGD